MTVPDIVGGEVASLHSVAPILDVEIPYQVSESISSWRRILIASNDATSRRNFERAAVELQDLARVNATKHPETTDIVRHAAAHSLHEMAAAVGIDLAEAQSIIEDAGREEVDAKIDVLDSMKPAAGWPTPTQIQSTLPPVEPFIPELLPDALRDAIFDVADRQQAPPDFAAVTAVCAIAAIVGNRVRIQPKQNDDWLVPPNLWGAIIGRPSAMKSPAMQSALAPVYAIQDEMRTEWESQSKNAQIDGALSGLDAKEGKKRAEKAIKNGDREGARGILASFAAEEGDEPACPRIVVNDATVEKLGELLNENPRGLLLVRDELPGFLARMEREEFQSERAFYLEAFNADGQFTYDRIGRGTVHIKNCTLSIIGGVQPSRIAPIVRGAMTGASNDGLVQRLQLAVWPDDLGSWKWVDRKPDMLARLTFEKTFRDLHNLAIGNPDNPAVLRFSPASQVLFREWMTEIQADARGGSLPSTLESHILKMPKTIASLALLFELIDGGRSEVNEIATRRALGWADYLRSHANRLYASGGTMAEDGARLIVERRRQLPPQFTPRDIQRKAWASLGDRDAVASAIDMLVSTHHCREVVPGRVQTVVATPKLFHSRQQFVKRFRWRFPAQRLSRSGIESCCHGGYFVGAIDAQICALREVLPQQSVGIFVGAALPGASWIAKIDLDSRVNLETTVLSHFGSLIPG